MRKFPDPDFVDPNDIGPDELFIGRHSLAWLLPELLASGVFQATLDRGGEADVPAMEIKLKDGSTVPYVEFPSLLSADAGGDGPQGRPPTSYLWSTSTTLPRPECVSTPAAKESVAPCSMYALWTDNAASGWWLSAATRSRTSRSTWRRSSKKLLR